MFHTSDTSEPRPLMASTSPDAERRRSPRRSQVDAPLMVGVVAGVSGLATFWADAQPTGLSSWDLLLTSIAVAAVAWVGAAASWWAISSFAGLVTVLAGSPVPMTIGIAAVLSGLWIGRRGDDVPVLRAATVGLALNVALWSSLTEPLGLVPALVVPGAIGLGINGLQRRRSALRRIVWCAAAATGSAVLISVLLLGIVGLSTREALADGASRARRGIDALRTGEYEVAAGLFASSADRLAEADRRLAAVWARPVRLVPLIGQHHRAAADLSREAVVSLRAASEALTAVDPGSLRAVGGRVDLSAVAAVEAPLRRVDEALRQLMLRIEDVDSVWLAGPIRDRLAGLEGDLAVNSERVGALIDAVVLAPQLLGSGDERRYLVLFTTPAKARGIGGVVGNYAEVTAHDGQISLSGFGRLSELDAASVDNGARCDDCPVGFVERYGRFGFTSGPGGAVGAGSWRNITMAAHYPDIAVVAQLLHAQSGRPRVDGVALMDIYVVEQFVRYTGPIDVPDRGLTVTEDNVVAFLLFEQYLDDDVIERIDALEVVGNEVIRRLLSQPMPSPLELGRDLGPLIAERRMLLWTDRPDEQQLLRRVSLLGEMPPMNPAGGFSVSINNALDNKIDAFLDVGVELELRSGDDISDVSRGPDIGQPVPIDGSDALFDHLVAEVTLVNSSPTGGLSEFVIGNELDLPSGVNRMLVTFYGPPGLRSATRDGGTIGLEAGEEAGWHAASTFIEIEPGEETTIRLVYQLNEAVSDLEQLVTWTQPLVRDRSDLGPLAPPAP